MTHARRAAGAVLSPLLAFLAPDADGVTRRVPDEFTTVTAALAAAAPGDTVQVAAGTYSPSANGETFPLWVTQADLHVLGAGRDATVLDAEGTGGVMIHNASGGEVRGFTLTGGLSTNGAGGIRIVTGSPEIADNTVIGNRAPISGAGMLVVGTATPWIHHNVVWENADSDTTDSTDPHGIAYAESAGGLLEHNLIGMTDGNGTIANGGAAPVIRNNIYFRNGQPSVTPRGRGICWLGSAPPTIMHNLFFENRLAAVLWPGGGGDLSAAQANAVSPGDQVYGNLEADPLFVDPGALDFHLCAGSPAIDAGDPLSPADPDGTTADIGPFPFPQTTGVGDPAGGPVAALRAVPSPFRGATEIRFELDSPGPARVTAIAVTGRRVATLLDRPVPAGVTRVVWDGTDGRGSRVPAGVYFLTLEVGGRTATASAVLLP